jgi:hypothetical protein
MNKIKKEKIKIQQKEFGSPLPNISKFWHSSLTKQEAACPLRKFDDLVV